MIKRYVATFLTILGCTVCSVVYASGLGSVISKQGDWTIYSSQDAMTDEKHCTATYKNRPDIQLTADTLAFNLSGRGGVQGYEYRLDDESASGMQIPSDSEKEYGYVIFKDTSMFDRIKSAKRLRFRAMTLFGGFVGEDIKLTTLPMAVNYLSGPNCK